MDVLDAPGVAEQRHCFGRRTSLLRCAFATRARPVADPHAATVTEQRSQVHIVGLFEMGTSFGLDASLLTSDTNFLRLFPSRSRDRIDLGLIQLDGTVAPEVVRELAARACPMMSSCSRGRNSSHASAPIGTRYADRIRVRVRSRDGVVVGDHRLPILFADVTDHLHEYATLRAIGYSNRFIAGIVAQQAVILALVGFVPGVAVTVWLYAKAGAATRLPLYLTWERAVLVFLLALAMCVLSSCTAEVRT
jgi:putative ABC transport system permease protein